jgi:hypothetical protein
MESIEGDSTTKSIVTNSIEDVRVIMIGCYFIQPIKLMLEGEKGFIHTHETIFQLMPSLGT